MIGFTEVLPFRFACKLDRKMSFAAMLVNIVLNARGGGSVRTPYSAIISISAKLGGLSSSAHSNMCALRTMNSRSTAQRLLRIVAGNRVRKARAKIESEKDDPDKIHMLGTDNLNPLSWSTVMHSSTTHTHMIASMTNVVKTFPVNTSDIDWFNRDTDRTCAHAPFTAANVDKAITMLTSPVGCFEGLEPFKGIVDASTDVSLRGFTILPSADLQSSED